MNNKGFTMVEVMLAVVIAGVITSAITLFFIVNVQGFGVSKKLTDLQYDGQATMNLLVDSLQHSEGIYDITLTNGNNAKSLKTLINPGSFTIKTRNGEYFQYIIDTTNLEISLKKSTNDPPDFTSSPEDLIEERIRSFSLEPVPNGTSFTTCKGVKIVIEIGSPTNNLTMKEEIRFRNK